MRCCCAAVCCAAQQQYRERVALSSLSTAGQINAMCEGAPVP